MLDRRVIVLFFAALSACRRGDVARGAGGPLAIKAIDVDSPIGGDGAGVSRCDHDGKKCVTIGKDDAVPEESLVKTAPGARASFELGPAATLDLGEDSAAWLAAATKVELARGSAVVKCLGNPADKADAFRIEVAGRSGEFDPKVGATVLLRTKGADRALVTVEKGKLTLRSSGGLTTVVLSGETVDLVKGKPPERVASQVAVEPHRSAGAQPALLAQGEPRGLGRMTARLPGKTDVVAGVRLVSHHVDVVLRDGMARTEIEEVFQNDTAQVLEGRYVFPLPADASISRLVLWVNDKPVEGEIVEKKRAAAIFKGIVDDTVRPRDPALLEWVAGGDFSLKIFPLPAKGSRKVSLAYDQVLRETGGRSRYVYPLSVGAERSIQIDDFAVQVSASDTRAKLGQVETPRYVTTRSGDEGAFRVGFGAKAFTPVHDFVVSYGRESDNDAELSAYVPAWGEFKGDGTLGAARGAQGSGYFALRLRADLPAGMSPAHVRRDRAIIVDTSHSQSQETLEGEAKLALAFVREMDPDERFVVLACDSACMTFPEAGLAAPTNEQVSNLEVWLKKQSPTGSSDVAGALLDAARRVDAGGSGQVVYLGDGAPSAGELTANGIAERVRSTLRDRKVDLRLLGAGRSVDDVVLGSLAQALGATYEAVTTGESIETRAAELVMSLRSPVIRAARVELPSSFGEVYPPTLKNLLLGEDVVLVGRVSSNDPGEVKLHGELDGQPYTLVRHVRWTPEASRQNPLVPRIWASARIADREGSGDAEAVKQIVDLSKRYHVMSRYTSLLVLENDQMFAEFGIKRTARAAGLAAGNLGDLPAGPSTTGALSPPVAESDSLAEGKATGADKAKKADVDFASGPADFERRATSPVKPSPAPTFAAPPSPAPASRAAPAAPAVKGSAMDLNPFESALRPEAEAPSIAADERFGSGHGALQGLGSGGGGLAGIGSSGRSSVAFVGNVRFGGASVSGGLPREVVERITRAAGGRFRRCYEMGLQRNPELAGRLGVRFVIGESGQVVASSPTASTLGDGAVEACVTATVRTLSFPAPEGGFVTVMQTLTFTRSERGDLAPRWRVQTEPSANHRAADDGWLAKGDEALSKLRAALDQAPQSRRKYEDLTRGLLARGRFEEALATARRFVAMDPDLPVARELLAYAAATSDDGPLAAGAIDTQTETDPSSVKWHVRGARAFEALGDERRACAHWRSLGELSPKSDEFRYEALRCRARVLDDRESVLAEVRSAAKPSKLLGELLPQIEASKPPPFAKSVAGAGQFEAEVRCFVGERCPTVVVVSPLGNVFSPYTPTDARSSAHSVAFSGLRSATYMTLLTGGSEDARGEVEVRAFGSTKKFPITHGGRQTVAATTITLPDHTRGFGTFSDGFLIAR
ncbi:MAG TPA: VIT domain-containing protein [Polyangiaceae bacterium]|nr:VIT domain-containing protein [Polyangiaceae bacterium]